MLRQLIAVAISTLCGILLAEVVLRRTLSIEDLYGPILTNPTVASEGWARTFERDYRSMRERSEIGADLGGYVHDPLLGWDVPGRVRHDELMCVLPGSASRRIIAVGDSFTYGAEVESPQSFPAQLQRLLVDTEVLNMGVRAYGVDQAALKLWMFGRPLRPDYIVFAIFGPDYYRTPLSFYRFAKPRFELDEPHESLTLAGVPVPPPDVVYDRLRRSLPLFWYGYGLARRVFLNASLWDDLTHSRELFYYRSDRLHEEILRRTISQANADGASILFVYVPQAGELESKGGKSIERARFTQMFLRLGANFVDLVPALLERHSGAETDELYLWTEGRAGHFTPAANRLVAEILADAVERATSIGRDWPEASQAPPTSPGGGTTPPSNEAALCVTISNAP